MNWIISHLPNQATIGILAGGLSVHIVMSLRNLKTQVTKHIPTQINNLEQDIKGVETKLESKIDKIESKVDKLETNLEQDIKGVETKLESKIDKLESKVDKIETKIDRKLEQVNIRLDDIYKLLLGQNRENKTSTTPKHVEKTTTLAT